MKRMIAVWVFLAALLAVPIVVAANESFAIVRAKAESGDATAQANLGLMYATGESVAKDPTEAMKWLRRAAEQANAKAQTCIGMMYSNGDGVAKDPVEAVKWFRKAADQGFAVAQYCLGVAYATGRGVAKDPTEAVKWYRKAADQGNAKAQCCLGWMYYTGTGVDEDQIEGMKWYRKAAEHGAPGAQFALGVAYATGRGAPKDLTEAERWYQSAAEQGDAAAQANLGLMYAEGEGVLKDEIEALAWLNVSAIKGNLAVVAERALLELRLGQQATLIAQQRSKEILKQIDAHKAARAARDKGANSLVPTILAGTPKASGSGAIVSTSGYMLTAAHVVADAESITVITSLGTKTATVIRCDEANDLAVLKIDAGDYVALRVKSSRGIRLGQGVATIGYPNVVIQGVSPKLTRGEISSLNGIADDPRAWQISVPVQPGNSGGPLLDEYGDLIGVVVGKLGLKAAQATGDLPQNVSYAVKSDYVLPLVEPYLDGNAPALNQPSQKPNFEEMVAKVQQAVVLILVY